MRAVRLERRGAPLRDSELPDPEPGPADIVVDIRSAGICHSDAHYRTESRRLTLPRTLGHEIAGTVSWVGEGVEGFLFGDPVALHYLLSCGDCFACSHDGEQFCARGAMLGKELDGGYAEKIVVPARNAVSIPDAVGFNEAAIMMCSTATAHHALRLATVRQGESVAILGFGGLGISAAQLAGRLDPSGIFAVDIIQEKLELAESFGAVPIDASRASVRDELLGATGGRGIDVVLDFAGHSATSLQALRSLAPGGRFMVVAIDLRALDLDPYADILTRERRIIGCSDHTRAELVELMDLARRGELDLSQAITRTVPLEAEAINEVLDDLDAGTRHLRTVIEM
ncbi:MAG TPA: zinc-binding dehydrogenase [Thermoanaerobaculia bacterium]|nr:zinc-binding dehydrogenase [Thermoanaerobaculia bacterium]